MLPSEGPMSDYKGAALMFDKGIVTLAQPVRTPLLDRRTFLTVVKMA
jgi:hypothetical protein